MNYSIFRIPLNLHSVQSQASVPVFKGDTSIQFRISLSDGVKPYIIEDGCLAAISIKRPGGSLLQAFCTIENNTTIVYSFDQNKNTTWEEGIHDCDVTLYGKDGGVLGSPRFTMVVNEKVVNSDDIIISDEDQTTIDAIIAQEASRQEAEKGRINNEAARVDAETDRAQAEQQRVLVEEARVAAEKLREANVVRVEEALRLANEAAEKAEDAAEKAEEAAGKADGAINGEILTESDIIDNLETSASNKPLSANQGVELKTLIEGLRDDLDKIDQSQPTNPGTGTPGANGVSVTHSWNGTILTLTSASGTTHTDLQGAPGKDGTDGEDGQDGYTPVKGVDYFDGKDGKDGVDGHTPEIINGYWHINGENKNVKAVATDGKDGTNGTDGKDGQDGQDGYTPIKGVDYFDGKDGKDGVDGHTPEIINGYWHINGENKNVKAVGTDGKDGKDGTNGTDGKNGYTPIKGVDYFDGKDGKDGVTPRLYTDNGKVWVGYSDGDGETMTPLFDIPQGTSSGSVQTIQTINGKPIKFFVGEKEEYDSLTVEEKENLYAIVTDDDTQIGIKDKIDGMLDGSIPVPSADNAKELKLTPKTPQVTSKLEYTITETGLYLILFQSGDYNNPVASSLILITDLEKDARGTSAYSFAPPESGEGGWDFGSAHYEADVTSAPARKHVLSVYHPKGNNPTAGGKAHLVALYKLAAI